MQLLSAREICKESRMPPLSSLEIKYSKRNNSRRNKKKLLLPKLRRRLLPQLPLLRTNLNSVRPKPMVPQLVLKVKARAYGPFLANVF